MFNNFGYLIKSYYICIEKMAHLYIIIYIMRNELVLIDRTKLIV